MRQKTTVNFYISKHSPKEARKRSSFGSDFYVIDITKIIRDLGYEVANLAPESEFILNHSIRNKITQGIYSTKCDSILVCYRNMPSNFKDNLEEFLGEFSETVDYSIHNL
jgi:hypothetical protein